MTWLACRVMRAPSSRGECELALHLGRRRDRQLLRRDAEPQQLVSREKYVVADLARQCRRVSMLVRVARRARSRPCCSAQVFVVIGRMPVPVEPAHARCRADP